MSHHKGNRKNKKAITGDIQECDSCGEKILKTEARNHSRKCSQSTTKVTLPGDKSHCVIVQMADGVFWCPYQGCQQPYSVATSLQKHVSNKHSGSNHRLRTDLTTQPNPRYMIQSTSNSRHHDSSTRRRSILRSTKVRREVDLGEDIGSTMDMVEDTDIDLDIDSVPAVDTNDDLDEDSDTEIDSVEGNNNGVGFLEGPIPGESPLQLIYPDGLKQYGYGVMVQYKLLICTTCKRAVIPHTLANHHRRPKIKLKEPAGLHPKCQSCPNVKAVLENLKNQYVLAETHYWPSTPINRIAGFPIYSAYMCTAPGCTVTFSKISTFRKQHKNEHDGQYQVPQACWAHCIFPKQYWPIKAIQETQPSDNDNTQTYVRLAHERVAALFDDDEMMYIPTNPNNIRGYLLKVGWVDLISDNTPRQPLFDIVQPPKNKESDLNLLRPYIVKYFSPIHNNIYQTDYTMRRWLNSDTLE
jgi:hypothetical protein